VTKVLNLPYYRIIKALRKDGWIVIRQKSHIRMQKHILNEVLKITIPAYTPVKRSTLAHILKQARIDLEHFLKLL